jgi:hypothetical protein
VRGFGGDGARRHPHTEWRIPTMSPKKLSPNNLTDAQLVLLSAAA